jgi:hypothetical protein
MAKRKTSIATVYDQVAEKYSRQFKDELQDKPLDRLLPKGQWRCVIRTILWTN